MSTSREVGLKNIKIILPFLPLVTTWIELEGIMLSEVRKTQILYGITCGICYLSTFSCYLRLYKYTHTCAYIHIDFTNKFSI